jgi:hypothetical protein
MTDIIARIDDAVARCTRCGTPLAENGPSPDFCGPGCQQSWMELFATRPREVNEKPPRVGSPAPTESRDGHGRWSLSRGAEPVLTIVDETTRVDDSLFRQAMAAWGRHVAESCAAMQFEVIPPAGPLVEVDASRFVAGRAGWYQYHFGVQPATRLAMDLPRETDGR